MAIQILVESFISEVCAGKTNGTPGAYRGKLHHLVNYCQGNPTITQDVVNCFRQWLLDRKTKRRGGQIIKEQLSPFTVRTILATTRHFLRWGAERGLWVPVELRNIQEPAPEPKAIDPSTFERLVKAALTTGEEWEQVRNTAILFVLRDSGCRCGAVANIDISDVDLARGVMSAMDKGGQMSWIYITDLTVQAVAAWMETRRTLEPVDYLLWTGQRRRGLRRLGIYRMIHRLAAAAGLCGVRFNPHSFRHAFARDALRNGADLSQVSQLLNHKSVVVTAKYYARWADKELREIHKRVSPMAGQGSAKP